MKIRIISRDALEKLAKKPFNNQVAVISITDVDTPIVKLENKPKEVLRLSFEDIDNDLIVDELGHNPTLKQRKLVEQKYNMFSNEQLLNHLSLAAPRVVSFATELNKKGFSTDPKLIRNMDDLVESIVKEMKL